jgi:uncharacterized protein YbaR (Trm112 family)
MHIEFIDLLRCPRPHEETWLVAAFYRMNGRQVLEGTLGCHVCGAEYPIHDGIAFFREQADAAPFGNRGDSEAPDSAMRIAAFLDLARPGALALLVGDLADASDAVAALTSSRIIALNAPLRTSDESVLQIDSNPPLPLASHSLDGIALDPASSSGEMLEEASRLLRPRGRLLAASGLELSGKFSELARDADYVVAEYIGDLVSIRH